MIAEMLLSLFVIVSLMLNQVWGLHDFIGIFFLLKKCNFVKPNSTLSNSKYQINSLIN